jgi:hypothetical protein
VVRRALLEDHDRCLERASEQLILPGARLSGELVELDAGQSFCCCLKPYLATTQVPRNAKTVTKTAVGMVELLPSLLLNLASGPQIAVRKTAIHIAVIASDAHISETRRRNHRGRSWAIWEGSCDRVDILQTSF